MNTTNCQTLVSVARGAKSGHMSQAVSEAKDTMAPPMTFQPTDLQVW